MVDEPSVFEPQTLKFYCIPVKLGMAEISPCIYAPVIYNHSLPNPQVDTGGNEPVSHTFIFAFTDHPIPRSRREG